MSAWNGDSLLLVQLSHSLSLLPSLSSSEESKKIEEDQVSSPQDDGGDHHLHLHSWLSSRSPLLFSPKSPLKPYVYFTMHGWKKKIASRSMISNVSLTSSLTQSCHGKSWFLVKSISLTWKQRRARSKPALGGPRVNQISKLSYLESSSWISLFFSGWLNS